MPAQSESFRRDNKKPIPLEAGRVTEMPLEIIYEKY